MTPEGKLKDELKKVFDEYGIWRAGGHAPTTTRGWMYMPVSNGFGVSGIPDFIGCIGGKFVAIETKSPRGVLTEGQKTRHKEIIAAGGIVLTIRKKEEFVEWLRQNT